MPPQVHSESVTDRIARELLGDVLDDLFAGGTGGAVAGAPVGAEANGAPGTLGSRNMEVNIPEAPPLRDDPPRPYTDEWEAAHPVRTGLGQAFAGLADMPTYVGRYVVPGAGAQDRIDRRREGARRDQRDTQLARYKTQESEADAERRRDEQDRTFEHQREMELLRQEREDRRAGIKTKTDAEKKADDEAGKRLLYWQKEAVKLGVPAEEEGVELPLEVLREHVQQEQKRRATRDETAKYGQAAARGVDPSLLVAPNDPRRPHLQRAYDTFRQRGAALDETRGLLKQARQLNVQRLQREAIAAKDMEPHKKLAQLLALSEKLQAEKFDVDSGMYGFFVEGKGTGVLDAQTDEDLAGALDSAEYGGQIDQTLGEVQREIVATRQAMRDAADRKPPTPVKDRPMQGLGPRGLRGSPETMQRIKGVLDQMGVTDPDRRRTLTEEFLSQLATQETDGDPLQP